MREFSIWPDHELISGLLKIANLAKDSSTCDQSVVFNHRLRTLLKAYKTDGYFSNLDPAIDLESLLLTICLDSPKFLKLQLADRTLGPVPQNIVFEAVHTKLMLATIYRGPFIRRCVVHADNTNLFRCFLRLTILLVLNRLIFDLRKFPFSQIWPKLHISCLKFFLSRLSWLGISLFWVLLFVHINFQL